MKGNPNVKQTSNNYARHIATGEYVFFADASAPAFTHPQHWAFFRRPSGKEAFVGQIVGENYGGDAASDPEAPASAAS
jgi:hypothetical protein